LAAVDKNKLIESATRFIAKNQYGKAIKDLQKVLTLEPKNNQIALKIAELFLKLHKKDEAAKFYEIASNIFKDSGFYDKAIAVYRQVLTINPLSSQAYLKLAELFRKKNLIAEAVSHYKVAIAIYEREGHIQDALKILKIITELEPSNLPGRMKLAELYIKNGLKNEAYAELSHISEKLIEAKRTIDLITVYERMLSVKSGDIAIMKQLIRLYLSRGDYQKVLLKVKEVIALGKSDTDVLIALAKAYIALEKTPLAISAYKEVAKLYSKEALNSQAQDIYKKILELDPTDQQALQVVVNTRPVPPPMPEIEPEPVDTGETAVHEKQPPKKYEGQPEKKTAPEQKGKLSAEEIDKYFSEAQVYKRYGLNEKAVEKLNQILEINPTHRASLVELFELYRAINKFKEVSKTAERLYNVLITNGEIEKAEAFVKEAIANDPDNKVLKALVGYNVEPVKTEQPAEQVVETEQPAEQVVETEQPSVQQQQAQTESNVEEIDTGIEIEVEPPLPEKEHAEAQTQFTSPVTTPSTETNEITPPPTEKEEVPIPEQIDFTPDVDKSAHSEETVSQEVPHDEEINFSFSDNELKEMGTEEPAKSTEERIPVVQTDQEQQKSDIDVIDSLDEAEFYYQQGILTEAKKILQKVLQIVPDEERAKKRLAEILAKEEESHPPAAKPVVSEMEGAFIQKEAEPVVSVSSNEDLFDLAQELENELSAVSTEETSQQQAEEEQQVSVEEVLNAFKKGVEKSVDRQDAETHYNLGIAYKEMGLIDEAINEFNIAILSPKRKADGFIMLGMSYMGKGLPGKAIEMYKQALAVNGGVKPENVGLLYEYALAFEAYGDMKSAYNYFEEVRKTDEGFREVKDKISKLGEFVKTEYEDEPTAEKQVKKEEFTLNNLLKTDVSEKESDRQLNERKTHAEETKESVESTTRKEHKLAQSEIKANEGKRKPSKKKVSYV